MAIEYNALSPKLHEQLQTQFVMCIAKFNSKRKGSYCLFNLLTLINWTFIFIFYECWPQEDINERFKLVTSSSWGMAPNQFYYPLGQH